MVGEAGRRLVEMGAAPARESVVDPGVVVDRYPRVGIQALVNLRLRLGWAELVLLRDMQHERLGDFGRFVERSLDPHAVKTDIAIGVTTPICSNSQFDGGRDGNKLSEHRFLRLNLAAPTSVSFSMLANPAPSTPSAGFHCTADDNDPENHEHSDPDLIVWRNGEFVLWNISCTPNEEISLAPQLLAAGEYVIDINEFRYDDSDTPDSFPEQVCFDFTAN